MQSAEPLAIDVRSLPNGVYAVIVETMGEQRSVTIVKEKR
jgi:hypothetical protein